ncbi:MAG: ADP-ribosyl-[dinitrogen reductase] hydrolase [Pseudomonadota bacterium]
MSNTRASDGLTGRAEAAYLGLALGDALGATVEFMTPREIRAAFARYGGIHREMIGGGWLRLKPGQVTDDTTMALALGDAILACDGRVEPLACAQAFDAWMRGKPIDIGNTVRRNLVTFRKTGDPVAPPSEHDAGNGAVMRVLPVALATLGQDDDAVRAAVRAQAHTTHHNVASDAACDCLVFMVQDALRGANLRDLYRQRIRTFVTAHPEFAFRPRRRENPSGWVVETLQAVLQALLDNGSFEACLIDVVNRGGDADTTGAIVGMLAGALHGPAGLPFRWIDKLDPAVRERCTTQGRALIAFAQAA